MGRFAFQGKKQLINAIISITAQNNPVLLLIARVN